MACISSRLEGPSCLERSQNLQMPSMIQRNHLLIVLSIESAYIDIVWPFFDITCFETSHSIASSTRYHALRPHLPDPTTSAILKIPRSFIGVMTIWLNDKFLPGGGKTTTAVKDVFFDDASRTSTLSSDCRHTCRSVNRPP